jgi:hypothetical protein
MHRLVTSLVLIPLVAAASGCGGGTVTVEKSGPPPATTTPPTTNKLASVAGRQLNNPAQQPDPHATVSCSEAARGHACVSGTAAPSNPNQFRQRNCDTNIVANSDTSCGLAENTFYEYYRATRNSGSGQALMVHSPTTGRDYELSCENAKGLVSCTGSPLATGIYVSFPQTAIGVYTEVQASAYARTRNVGKPGPPASSSKRSAASRTTPSPTPGNGGGSSSGGDQVGSYSHADDQAFCEQHRCIGAFQREGGTVAECNDGTYSHAGRVQGTCSHHEGVRRD